MMMNIETESIKVYKDSVIPAISFTVSDSLENDTILYKVDGIVLSADWKYIANIIELPDIQVRNYPTVDGRLRKQVSKVISISNENDDDDNNNNKKSITKTPRVEKRELMFTLNKHIIDHMEKLRQRSKNNDVIIYFVLQVSYLQHLLKLGLYSSKFIEDGSNIIVLSDVLTEHDNINLRILVNGDKENRLLFYMVDEFRRQVIIPSNKWDNSFQGLLINSAF
jgi:hypothetical protein